MSEIVAAPVALRATIHAELTKIWSVRSTFWSLLAFCVLSVGLGALFALSFRSAIPDWDAQRLADFDPLFVSFYSLTMGQLALVVFAVFLVGSEYGSGTIRASLLAVPRRGLFYTGKLLAGALPMFVAAVVTVPATFLVSQAVLGPYGVGIGSDGALTAVVGACLYVGLIGLFAAGVATMLRSSLRSLAILMPVFFLGSQGVASIPGAGRVLQFLPDQTGWVVMHLTPSVGDGRFSRDYGAWTGLGLLALWVTAALAGGYLVLRRRDA
nr:ABC transporter permease subunit [Micromonospora sp. DSM 115978]